MIFFESHDDHQYCHHHHHHNCHQYDDHLWQPKLSPELHICLFQLLLDIEASQPSCEPGCLELLNLVRLIRAVVIMVIIMIVIIVMILVFLDLILHRVERRLEYKARHLVIPIQLTN